jgi:hypothetical protein
VAQIRTGRARSRASTSSKTRRGSSGRTPGGSSASLKMLATASHGVELLVCRWALS